LTDNSAIWDEIFEAAREYSRDPAPDEISIRAFAEKIGLSQTQARDYLEKMLEKGKLKKRRYLGKYVLYSPTGDKMDTDITDALG